MLVFAFSNDSIFYSGIVTDVKYDNRTNQMVGLLLPTDTKTGCPIPFTFLANTMEDIENNITAKQSTLVYVVLAKVLGEDYPPFVLQVNISNTNYRIQYIVWYITHHLASLTLNFFLGFRYK